jgi:hypothetical protein
VHERRRVRIPSQVRATWRPGARKGGREALIILALDVRFERERMPECKLGMKCPNRLNGKCYYRHTPSQSNCTFYSQVNAFFPSPGSEGKGGAGGRISHRPQGFCQLGSTCKFDHVKRPVEELPFVGSYSQGVIIAKTLNMGTLWHLSDNEVIRRRAQVRFACAGAISFDVLTPCRTKGVTDLFKTSLCRFYDMHGVCPNGVDCNFAHGKAELRANHHNGARQSS